MPSRTPTQAEADVLGVYQDAEAAVLAQITRTTRGLLDVADQGADISALDTARAQAVTGIRAAVARVVHHLDGKAPGLIEAALGAAATQGSKAGAAQLAQITGAAPRADYVPRGALDRLAAAVLDRITPAHAAILRVALDGFRTVAQQVVPAVLVGADTRRDATQRALWQLTDRGITGLTDVSGRRWSLSAYAEMAVRTATARAHEDAKHDRIASAGIDLLIVQGSSDRCPICRPWSGAILSLTGSGRRTVTVEHALRDGEMLSIEVAGSMEDARAAGFAHPQCRCSTAAYLPGITRQPAPAVDDGQYEARQRQRTIERQIRAGKARQAAALDEPAARRATAQVKAAQARMREHLDANPDLLRRRYREQPGTGNNPTARTAGPLPARAETVPAAPSSPTTPSSSAADDRFATPAERAVADAYAELATKPGQWVGLAELRDKIGGKHSRADVDRALEGIATRPGVHVAAEPNQKALTARDRAAAVRFGGDDRHMLHIERPRTGEEVADRPLASGLSDSDRTLLARHGIDPAAGKDAAFDRYDELLGTGLSDAEQLALSKVMDKVNALPDTPAAVEQTAPAAGSPHAAGWVDVDDVAAQRAAIERVAAHYRDTVTLTAAEQRAIDAYTQADPYHPSERAAYDTINGALRTGEALSERGAQMSADLDTAAAKYRTAEQLTVWRNMGGRYRLPADLAPGQVHEDLGWVSTSHDAAMVTSGRAVHLEIEIPAGTHGISVPGARLGGLTDAEAEFILPRGTRFEVVAVEMRGEARWLRVVALPPEDASGAVEAPEVPKVRTPRRMTDAELDEAMQAALAVDDMDAFDVLAAEGDRRDAAKAARRERDAARAAARDEARAVELERLIDAGHDEQEAVAQVYGVSVDKQRRAAAIAQLRGDGYRGKGFDELSRASWKDTAYARYDEAEAATNGYMLNADAARAGFTEASLFTAPESQVRKYASPEMLEWFDQNGRPSLAEHRATLLGDSQAAYRLGQERGDFHT